MYGRAMSCDVCDKVVMLPIDVDVYSVDGAPVGWIRLLVNKPPVYGWKSDDRVSPQNGAWDCCSLACAESVLSEGRKMARELEAAEVSA